MKTFSVLSVLALPFIAGCATQAPVKEPPVMVADRPAAAPVDVGIEWGWRIVGDAAVRPVQVFSMNGQTYLHMRDRRPVVLLVGREVLPFLTSWPYLVIQGEPDRVDVVLDGYRAVLERTASRQPESISGAQPRAGAIVERVSVQQKDSDGSRRIERVKIQ